jgi:protoheme IX farnesyltransferase
MVREEPLQPESVEVSSNKLRDYMQLVKPNLSFLVVFSSVIGYLLAPNTLFEWDKIIFLFLGGALVTSGANIINEIIERDTDKLMKRTAIRPLPDGRMQVKEAVILSIITSVAGFLIMYFCFNAIAAFISLASSVIYAFMYTPMKRIHPVCILIGAVPGALPPLIGWAAATGSVTNMTDLGGWALFLLQFFWQFPHLWAIAWVGYEDYQKAGIRMLPSAAGRTSFTGLQCMFYSATLIPIGILPYNLGMIGQLGLWLTAILGVFYFLASFNFYLKNDKVSAKKLMYASFIYLPISLIAMLVDKI